MPILMNRKAKVNPASLRIWLAKRQITTYTLNASLKPNNKDLPMDEFVRQGIIVALHREYMRGFEHGYAACVQIMEGVLKAAIEDKNMVSQCFLEQVDDSGSLPEISKALIVAMRMAMEKETLTRLTKAESRPMSMEAARRFLQEIEKVEDLNSPLLALAGNRNRPPKDS